MTSWTLSEVLEELDLEAPVCRDILIVDDEPENLFVLEATLEDDWNVRTASNGAEALQIFEDEGGFDLVISDQRMPHMTGVELLTHIARRSPETIRVVLTAYVDVDPIVAAINDGAVYRFLLKPWERTVMRAAVVDALELKAQQTALLRVVERLARNRASLRQTINQLKRTQDQLLAAERMSSLGTLTSGITHDLGNQLNAMVLLVDTVQQGVRDPTLFASARKALTTLESLFYLVSDVNAFARNKSIEPQREPVRSAHFIEETLRFLRLESVGWGRRIDVAVDPAFDVIDIDPHRVRQALLALLRNAAEATSSGAEIAVRVEPEGPHGCAICVVDKGIGMDERTLARAAEAFFSGFDNHGLGLGLEIAQLVANAHDGRLELTSHLGEGTTARLVLGQATSPDGDRPAPGEGP